MTQPGLPGWGLRGEWAAGCAGLCPWRCPAPSEPRFQEMLGLSPVPGSPSLMPAVTVPAGLWARAGICFGILGGSLDALEPSVAFPVWPLWAGGVGTYRDTGHLAGGRCEGCAAAGALLWVFLGFF